MWIAAGKDARVLVITGGDASPALEVQKGVVDQMAPFIALLAIQALDFAVLFCCNDGHHTLSRGLSKNGVAVIAYNLLTNAQHSVLQSDGLPLGNLLLYLLS